MRSLFAFALLCACGDNVVGIPFEELEAASIRAQCERFVRCGVASDLEACTSFFRRRPDKDLARAIDARIVNYSGPAAEQCLAALAAQSCDTSSRDARTRPRACAEMFGGTLGGNAPCKFDEECESGICSRPNCTELCCTGTCRSPRQPAPIDGSCELDVDCVVDAFCGPDFRCHPLGGEGALCSGDQECAFGSACIGPTQLMPGNCRKQPLLGEPCLYMRCAELGAMCSSGMCVPLGVVGSTCTGPNDCSPLLQCVDSVCTETPRLGEPCTLGCAGEAWCDFDAGLCVEPKGNTEPCSADDQCASQFCDEGIVFENCAERAACF